jgi:hypothetical protein
MPRVLRRRVNGKNDSTKTTVGLTCAGFQPGATESATRARPSNVGCLFGDAKAVMDGRARVADSVALGWNPAQVRPTAGVVLWLFCVTQPLKVY